MNSTCSIFRSILNWDNKTKTILTFAAFLLVTYFIEPWMVTLGLLIPFVKNIIVSLLSFTKKILVQSGFFIAI